VILLLAALVACGETDGGAGAPAPATPPGSAQAPAAPQGGPAAPGNASAGPTPAPALAPPASVTVWNVDTIDGLVPVRPAREGKVARAVTALPQHDVALQLLKDIVARHASDPDNPWAVAHGVLAEGPGFRLSGGREVLPHLFATYAEARTFTGASGKARVLPGFPASRGAIRIEPHTDLLLKNFAEVGYAPEARAKAPFGETTLADLYRATVLKTYLDPARNHSSFKDPNDVVWGLQALAQWAPAPEGTKPELQWVASDGTPMDLDTVTNFAAAVLTQESAFLFEDFQQGRPFQRAGQNLFSYTCGGSHLLQGASYAVARGFGSEMDRKAVVAQVPLLFYRLPGELRVYDEAMKQNPKHRTRLLVQRVKFLGHWLETTSKMQAMGLFVPTDAQMKSIEGAATNLVLTLDALRQQGTFDQLPQIRAQNEQLFLDIVGDSGHAIRGLELALGRGTIAY
jgi:hypothetical protein